jgi:hypothetical protein
MLLQINYKRAVILIEAFISGSRIPGAVTHTVDIIVTMVQELCESQ